MHRGMLLSRGYTGVRGADIVEALAEQFCHRVDCAPRYLQAPAAEATLAGQSIAGRRLADGTFIASLKAATLATGMGYRVVQCGEAVLLTRDEIVLSLPVGAESAALSGNSVPLHFATLRSGNDDYLLDLATVSTLLELRLR